MGFFFLARFGQFLFCGVFRDLFNLRLIVAWNTVIAFVKSPICNAKELLRTIRKFAFVNIAILNNAIHIICMDSVPIHNHVGRRSAAYASALQIGRWDNYNILWLDI